MTEIIKDYIKRFSNDRYLLYHAPRYSTLLDLIKEEYEEGKRILDIGRSKLTEIISDSLKTSVDTLGFQPDSDTDLGRHYHFDLNNSQNMELWRRDMKPYDLIVFAEVIEHLYTSPNLVLSFINSITSEEGRVLLQTPNAVCLANRIKMLLGRNPFEKIRENDQNPGHFREYTKQEIIEYSENTGFQVDKFIYGNYFDYQYWNNDSKPYVIPNDESPAQRLKYKLYKEIYSLSPGSCKPGMTLVLVKKGKSNICPH